MSQEATVKSLLTTVKNINTLRTQIIDKQRTAALANITVIKAAVDALNTALQATSVPKDFDTLG